MTRGQPSVGEGTGVSVRTMGPRVLRSLAHFVFPPHTSVHTYGVVVRLLLHQLRSHVQRGALDRSEDHCVTRHGACKAKVTQLDGAVRADQDVLGLHVSEGGRGRGGS